MLLIDSVGNLFHRQHRPTNFDSEPRDCTDDPERFWRPKTKAVVRIALSRQVTKIFQLKNVDNTIFVIFELE